VDDASAMAFGHHVGAEGLGAQQCARQVDGQDPVPVLQADVGQAGPVADCRIVHEDSARPQVLQHFGCCRCHTRG